MQLRHLALLLAVLAVNSDFIFTNIFGIQSPYLTLNWLILPPILIYLILSRTINLRAFTRGGLGISIMFLLCVASQWISQAAGESSQVGLMSASLNFSLKQIANCFVAFFIFYNLVTEEGDVGRFLNYLALSTIINTLLIVAIYLRLVSPAAPIAEGWVAAGMVDRVGLGDPNITFLYCCAGCGLWFTLAGKSFAGNKLRYAACGVAILGAALPIVLGLSRGALVAFAISVALGLGMVVAFFRTRTALRYGVIVGIVGLAAVCLQPERVSLILERMAGAQAGFSADHTRDSIGQRLMSAGWLGREMVTSPSLYGRGYDHWYETSGSFELPHFSYVDVYIAGGAFALLLLLYFLGKNVLRLFQAVRRETDLRLKSNYLALLVYVVAILVMVMSVSVPWMKVLWAAFAIMARTNLMYKERHALSADTAGEFQPGSFVPAVAAD